MKNSSFDFGDLLTEGIYAIQNAESKYERKSIFEIEAELAKSINRKPSTIAWFRKGNPPVAQFETEALARIIFIRGSMDFVWLERFLKSANHPNWISLREEFASLDNKQIDSATNAVYKRIKLDFRREILLDGVSNTFHELEIQATSEAPLSIIRHRIINSANSIHDFSLELNQSKRDDTGEIKAHISTTNQNIYAWVIEFLPPLLRGNHAYYSYTTSSRGSISMYSEEVHQQFLEGSRPHNFEYWGITITAPTDEMHLSIIFPPKYPISLPITGGFGVYQGLSDVLEEKTRIILMHGFSAKFNHELKQWSLELNVHNAKLGFSYQLDWLPPSIDLLDKIK